MPGTDAAIRPSAGPSASEEKTSWPPASTTVRPESGSFESYVHR
jgi:hypothetical protein